MMCYFAAISVEDDLRGLNGNLDALFYLGIAAAGICLAPNFIVEVSTWPDLVKDLLTIKRSSNVYRTGAYEMCSLDDDLKKRFRAFTETEESQVPLIDSSPSMLHAK